MKKHLKYQQSPAGLTNKINHLSLYSLLEAKINRTAAAITLQLVKVYDRM